MKRKLVYCTDAYCGWCYGFGPELEKTFGSFKNELSLEVLSGGMILPDYHQTMKLMAPMLEQEYKRVEDLTSVTYGEPFLWHVFHSDESKWELNSIIPAIALSIIKEHYPDQALYFLEDIQRLLNKEGKDLTLKESYLPLLEKYHLNKEDFLTKMDEEKYEDLARYDFAQVQQLGVTSFPTLLLEESEHKFYLVAKGYTDADTLSERLKNILIEIESKNN